MFRETSDSNNHTNAVQTKSSLSRISHRCGLQSGLLYVGGSKGWPSRHF